MDTIVIICARCGLLYAVGTFLILPVEARLSDKDITPSRYAGQLMISAVHIILSGRVLGWW